MIIIVLIAHLYFNMVHLNSSSATVRDKSLKLCVVAFYIVMYCCLYFRKLARLQSEMLIILNILVDIGLHLSSLVSVQGQSS